MQKSSRIMYSICLIRPRSSCLWIKQWKTILSQFGSTPSLFHSQSGDKNRQRMLRESEGLSHDKDGSSITEQSLAEQSFSAEQLSQRIQEYKEYQQKKGVDVSWVDKVLYSSFLQKHQPRRSFKYRLRENALKNTYTAVERVGTNLSNAPISWKYLDDDAYANLKKEDFTKDMENSSEDASLGLVHDIKEKEPHTFPYQSVTKTVGENLSEDNKVTPKFISEATRVASTGVDLDDLLDGKGADKESENDEDKLTMIKIESGKPDPYVKPSKVPCGGCGAYLHCQDSSIPGYISSDRFNMVKDLRGELCLRCYCLKNYNTALNVNIDAKDYPKVLKELDNHFAMVLLLVDLTDFPCSIWPGISDIIGTKRPVFLVGNKVDLIPRDSKSYLQRIKDGLYKAAKETGLASAKIVHTTVISATTGFGVEDLITKISNVWGSKGNIFIMGCTNVGKSSLFNALIQSDLCKPDVVELVQKATISQWPGTTLNLLKFPIMRSNQWRDRIRQTRLQEEALENLSKTSENIRMLRATHDSKFSVLTGTIGRSMLSNNTCKEIEEPMIVPDVFRFTKYPPRHIPKTGEWDQAEPTIQGKWCYDTPGVVNENQILDILTLPELMKTLPKQLIQPRTYFIKPGMSLFVGGLARIDYIEGIKPIRYTVFCSAYVPITIVLTVDADFVYKKALGTNVLGVPEGNADRLSKYPSLSPTNFSIVGEGHGYSCGDIVLSSAGWIAVTVGNQKSIQLKVHTPNGNGLFLRQPSILPYAVTAKGPRIRGTLAYLPHKVYLPHPYDKH